MSKKRVWISAAWSPVLAGILLVPPFHAEVAAAAADNSTAAAQQSGSDSPFLSVGNPAQSITAHLKTLPIGPGVNWTTFNRLDSKGWVQGQILQVDLGNQAVKTNLLFPGTVSATARLSEMAQQNGAIAAVNGDLYDINGTNAPFGIEIQNGKLVKGPVPSWNNAAGVGKDGLGRLVEATLQGTVKFPEGSCPLSALNQSYIPNDGVGIYTPEWGTASRSGAVSGGWAAKEILVSNGKVVSVSNQPGSGPIPANSYVIVARDASVAAFDGLKAGDSVSVTFQAKPDTLSAFQFAVGGNTVLLKNGAVQQLDDKTADPRTAIGYSEDGKTMYLVTVDGRRADSRGLTMKEFADMLQSIGVANSLNLDGGGSATMAVRQPGDSTVTVVNQPSDGKERPVPNGIGIFTGKGSGQPAKLTVSPVSEQDNWNRIFPGLSRSLKVNVFDETYAPAAANGVQWQSLAESMGTVDQQGVFTARQSGDASVQASVSGIAQGKSRGATKQPSGQLQQTVHLKVLGELNRIETAPDRISLTAGESATFRVTGFDQDGYSAPIEPRDVHFTYDTSLIQITPTNTGEFRITPTGGNGSAVVIAEVAGIETKLAVSVGLQSIAADDFEEADNAWRFSTARATGGLEKTEGRTGAGIKIHYDFTQSTATRTANIHPQEPIALPDKPKRIGVWVNGANKGEWIAFTVQDAAGNYYNLYGPHVNWTGWQYAEATVPDGVQYPLKLTTIGAIETADDHLYQGELTFDDLTVRTLPAVSAPVAASATNDPIMVQSRTFDGDRWKFAVLTGDRLIAAADSKQAAEVQSMLQDIVKENPDFLVVTGDLAAKKQADIAFVNALLQQEIGGKFPVYYVPGEGERTDGNLNAFWNAFPQNNLFDHKGTRVVMLDSSTGSFRTANFQQLIGLRAQLNQAAADPAVQHVLVVSHYPLDDAADLQDPQEAGLIEKWMADFHAASGKEIAYVNGHADTTSVKRQDGVVYLTVGSYSQPRTGDEAASGNSRSWNLVGIGVDGKGEWLQTKAYPAQTPQK
ncbi:phosphodiester glycosidase family protein [Effusibacillus dendaii]|uniref:Metallophosphoesterase n=1 Tax=Effusibacillus dendaii TaxID=2743772 RepID=A0A7I8D9S3_9BACL|nr:phosphodiester glycosidase family protein [Effusibacillus dendaii]BCJ86747.1 hypothetical protein skT53_17320 [Effusibacillus dendaii]